MGAVTPLLPRNRQHFCDLIGGVTVAVRVLCYVGVALAPDLAVHQATDLVEPRLAGNWRGIFIHKNIAGEMMRIFVFVGIYVAAVRSAAAGWSIIVAAVVFLIFTEAKAAVAFSAADPRPRLDGSRRLGCGPPSRAVFRHARCAERRHDRLVVVPRHQIDR